MSAGHIRQRSPGSFELRYRVDGRVHTTTVRTTSKKAAQAALHAVLTAADRGEHVKTDRTTVAEHVRARIEQWQASGKIGARTREHYEALAVQIAAGLGAIPLQRLTTLDVERWHLVLSQRGLAPRTMRAAHALLARALADAVRHRLISRNVARDQGPPGTEPSAAVTAPNAEQVDALLAGLEGDPWHVPVLVALYTGIRRGEQLALKWSNVDLDRARLHVREALDQSRANGVTAKAPKTGAGRRTISLPAIVVDALCQHRKAQLERCLLLGLGKPSDDALVFPADDGGYQTPRAFTMRWARVAARIGMPLTWHSLRHAHASMLIHAGVPITTVAARLGHGDPSITLKVYSHLYDRDDSAAAAAIDALG